MNHVWRRLTNEYLLTLIKRRKSTDNNQPPLKVGDVEWVLNDLTPRGIWPLGRAVEIFPGRDGEVQVAQVKTDYGSLVRLIADHARVFFHSFFLYFRSGLRQQELHPPPSMLSPLHSLLISKSIGSRISDQTTIKMIFKPCPPSWSMFTMTLGTQEKHEIFR